MEMSTLPNGNLKFSLERGDKSFIKQLLGKNGGDDKRFMASLLEDTGWQGIGKLYLVKPEDIGALTDAPIVTDDFTIEDDGSVKVDGTVWWYPNYEFRHFASDFLEQGYTVFQKAPDIELVSA